MLDTRAAPTQGVSKPAPNRSRRVWSDPCLAHCGGMNAQPDEEEMERAVIEYLRECPESVESLSGIAEWWLLRRELRVNVESLGRVLTRLTASGVLETFGSGEWRLYRLKASSK